MEHWDVVVVGGGPAGAACAAAVRRAAPAARVLVLDVLADLGLDSAALTAGYPPVERLRLRSPGGTSVERPMHRPASVVPREVFDARLLTAAVATGVEFRRHTVRRLTVHSTHVDVDARFRAAVVVGADGAESVVRRALGIPPNRPDQLALAIRGYAPEPAAHAGVQSLLTTAQRWPAYAWSFPLGHELGSGRANVGYGELVSAGGTRATLLAGMAELLPGADPTGLRAHRLPLSTGRPRQPDGRVLLAGDAASLINPLTGEGIFYAVLSGALAGSAALRGRAAGRSYRRALDRRLARHLRHSALASRVSAWPWVMDAVLRAAAHDQRVFDDVVALGLADGRLTARTLAAAVRCLRLLRRDRRSRTS